MALKIGRLPLNFCGENILKLHKEAQILNAALDIYSGLLYIYLLYDDANGFLGVETYRVWVCLPGFEFQLKRDPYLPPKRLKMIGYVPSGSKSLSRTHVLLEVDDV